MKREAKITREIQKRTQDREVDKIEQLQKHQLEEKQEIFHKYLPNTLVGDMVAEFNDQEKKDIAELKASLEEANKKRITEMEKQEKELEEALLLHKAELANLSEAEKDIINKQLRRSKVDNEAKRRKEAVENAEDTIKKVRDEYEKGWANLGTVYEEERKKQQLALEEKLRGRKSDVAEARKDQEDKEIQRLK